MANNVISINEKEQPDETFHALKEKTQLLVKIHNDLNEYEKLCCITTNQLATEMLKDNPEIKRRLEDALIENKAKIGMLKTFSMWVTEI